MNKFRIVHFIMLSYLFFKKQKNKIFFLRILWQSVYHHQPYQSVTYHILFLFSKKEETKTFSMSVNETDELPRKLSYISITSEDQTNAISKIGIIGIEPLKQALSDTQPTTPNEIIPPFSIGKIYKNLLLLSLAFVLMFTAYNGMVTLQSSLNVKNNVGVNSLIITYTFLIVN